MIFQDSIIDGVEIRDVVLLGIPFLGYIISYFFDFKISFKAKPLSLIIMFTGFIFLSFNIPTRFEHKFNRLKHTHKENEAIPVLYSPFANLIHQYTTDFHSSFENPEYLVENIISQNKKSLANRSNGKKFESIVIILVESFESFVLNLEIDGNEITPYLTNLSKEENTLYVPKIIPQVGVGRSIDAQLIINSGLLPSPYEIFCFDYAGNEFPSIANLMRDKLGTALSIDIISDMPSIYNQGVLSSSLGYNRLLSRGDFTTNPKSLIHVDDSIFFVQAKDKLSNELWPIATPTVIQIVSYSTHQPFKLPSTAAKMNFKTINKKLSKYLNAIRRTDYALKNFIEYLKNRGDYNSMLIIITGDHNVFSSEQYHEWGIDTISPYNRPYVPLIILNSEEKGKISEPKMQSAIFSTILELSGMTDVEWPGISKSVFNNETDSEEKQEVSEYIIRHNYFQKSNLKGTK